MATFRVSAKSKVPSVAGAIANVIKEGKAAEISVIGAGALNQAIKAIATARGLLAPQGIEIVCTPAFDCTIDERTAIKLLVGKGRMFDGEL